MTETQSVRTPAWMTLAPDERVLLRTRPSTNLILAGVFGGFFLITFGSLPFIALSAVDAGRRVTFALTGLVVALVVASFVLIKTREYALTNKRVSVASGLTDKDIRSVDLEAVRDVALEQGRLQRLVNVGTLRFVTDGGEDDLEFDFVGDPHYVYEQALDFL